MKSRFNLSEETKEDMLAEIKYYFLQERNEDLGELAALMILDFFEQKLAAHFYNQGVADSHQYISERIEDLFGIQK